MPNSCFIFIPRLVGCWWGFVCCPVHGQVSLHMPKFQCRPAILITSVARWFERLLWSTSWAQSVADGSGGWGLEPMYTVHFHFHPLHFYNPPKDLFFVLGSHNRKTCRSARALGDNEQGVAGGGGGTPNEGNPHLTTVWKYGSLSLFCPSLIPVPLRLSNALSGLGTVAHVYVIPQIGRSYNCSFPLLLVGSQTTWSSRRPVFRKGAGAVGKSRH